MLQSHLPQSPLKMLYNFPIKTSDFENSMSSIHRLFSLLPASICVKTSPHHPPLITLQSHPTMANDMTSTFNTSRSSNRKPSHIFNSLIKIDAQIIPQLPHVCNSPTLLLLSPWRLLLSSTPPSAYNFSKSPTRHLQCSKII